LKIVSHTIPPNPIFFLPANVFTFVGLGPVLPAALFRLTALALCESLIRVALARGTHFGYFRFASAFCFEPFLFEPFI
jgi:hypothetical protein